MGFKPSAKPRTVLRYGLATMVLLTVAILASRRASAIQRPSPSLNTSVCADCRPPASPTYPHPPLLSAGSGTTRLSLIIFNATDQTSLHAYLSAQLPQWPYHVVEIVLVTSTGTLDCLQLQNSAIAAQLRCVSSTATMASLLPTPRAQAVMLLDANLLPKLRLVQRLFERHSTASHAILGPLAFFCSERVGFLYFDPVELREEGDFDRQGDLRFLLQAANGVLPPLVTSAAIVASFAREQSTLYPQLRRLEVGGVAALVNHYARYHLGVWPLPYGLPEDILQSADVTIRHPVHNLSALDAMCRVLRNAPGLYATFNPHTNALAPVLPKKEPRAFKQAQRHAIRLQEDWTMT